MQDLESATNLVIRPAREGDRPAWNRLWTAYLEFYGTGRPRSQFDLTWRRIMDSEESMYSCLAFSGDACLGLVNFLYHRSFWDDSDRCYLQDLYVDPKARGQGIGAKLIAAVGHHAEAAQSSGVYWLTAEDNDRARRLYDHVAVLTPFIRYNLP
ncbi:MAG: GNAT family N-acetyltransferase [Paracoccaceae bacterium]|nr:GNAT family N-acetyltransferase [Paracoccaceae bacterium]